MSNPTAVAVSAGYWQGEMPGSNTQVTNITRSRFCGVVSFGGALWMMLEFFQFSSEPPVFANSKVVVFKSTDSGATWTAKDPTNGPQPQTQDAGGAAHNLTPTYAFANVGQYLYCLSVKGNDVTTQGLYVATFDMSAAGGNGAWTASTATEPNTDPAHAEYIPVYGLTAPSAGVFHVVYTLYNVGPVMTISANRYSGGAWQTAHGIGGALTNPIILGMFMDPATGVTHIAYGEYDASDPKTIRYVALDSTGALGIPSVITMAAHVPFGGNNALAVSSGVVWNNKIIFPYYRYDSGLNETFPAIFVGTPVATPGWTSLDVSATPLSTGFSFVHTLFALVSGGNLYVFWESGTQLLYNINTGGGFGPDNVFYDSSLGVEPDQPPTGLSIASPSAGNFDVELTMADQAYYLIVAAPATGFGNVFM